MAAEDEVEADAAEQVEATEQAPGVVDIKSAKSFLSGTEDKDGNKKDPVNTLHISGLGPHIAPAGMAAQVLRVASTRLQVASRRLQVDRARPLQVAQFALVLITGICGITGEMMVFSKLDKMYIPKTACPAGSHACQWRVSDNRSSWPGFTCTSSCSAKMGAASCVAKSGEADKRCRCSGPAIAISGTCVEEYSEDIERATCAHGAAVPDSFSSMWGYAECGPTAEPHANYKCTCRRGCLETGPSGSGGARCTSKSKYGFGAEFCVDGEDPHSDPAHNYKCGAEHMICQTIILKESSGIFAEAVTVDSGLSVGADLGAVKGVSVGFGRAESAMSKTCGVREDTCDIRRDYFYESEFPRPPLPYTALWLIYRLFGLPLLLKKCGCWAGGRMASIFRVAFAECWPAVPRGHPLVSGILGLFTFAKLYVVPQLMLPMMSTMEQAGACDHVVTRAPSFLMLNFAYYIVVAHLTLSGCFAAVSAGCLPEEAFVVADSGERSLNWDVLTGRFARRERPAEKCGVKYLRGRNVCVVAQGCCATFGAGSCLSVCIVYMFALDICVVAMLPVYFVIMITQYNAVLDFGISVAFTFDIKASIFVDFFQLDLFFLTMLDFVTIVLEIVRKTRAVEASSNPPVGEPVAVEQGFMTTVLKIVRNTRAVEASSNPPVGEPVAVEQGEQQ